MDRIQSMRIFCSVAETLRFRSAAERFDMSSAMVSKHVSALENEIGARLLTRNSRHVALTEEGRIYFERAKCLVDEFDDLNATIGKRATELAGVIRISAPVWMANKRLAQILKFFSEQNPEVTFDIDLSARHVNLVEDEFDLALRVSPKLAPGLIAKPLMPISFGLYASADYLAANGVPDSIENIFTHPILTYSGGPRLEDYLKPTQRRKVQAELKAPITTENGIFLLEAACIGMGLVVLPNWLADKAVSDGSIKRLLTESFDANVRLHAVYSSRRLLPARVREFINYL